MITKIAHPSSLLNTSQRALAGQPASGSLQGTQAARVAARESAEGSPSGAR
jgi:hypothetical protein